MPYNQPRSGYRLRRPHRRPRLPPFGRALVLGLTALLLAYACACRTAPRPLPGRRWRTVRMHVTAYCPCGTCCGWTRDSYGRPVYAYGPLKGRPKQVGICADGTRAGKGTIAADTRYYPFGTRMYVPGYGYGTVHDRGGAIKGGNHIDVFFPTHQQALQWGRKTLVVRVAR